MSRLDPARELRDILDIIEARAEMSRELEAKRTLNWAEVEPIFEPQSLQIFRHRTRCSGP